MISADQCAAIVLAAGRSERFGKKNKLLHPFRGRALAQHVAMTIGDIGFAKSVAVVSDGEVEGLFVSCGFTTVRSEKNSLQGASLLAGAQAVSDAMYAVVFLGDMPLITADHVQRLMVQATPEHGAVTRSGMYLGPPALLPLELLRTVDPGKDRGAKSLLSAATPVDAAPEIMVDIDRLKDLKALVAGESCSDPKS